MNETHDDAPDAAAAFPPRAAARARRVRGSVLMSLAVLAWPLALHAGSPLLPVGDDGALFFTAGASERYDSNVFLSSANAESDTITTLSPGLSLELGKNATTSTRVSLREDLLYYAKHSDQNDSLSALDFSGRMPGARTTVEFAGTFEQLRQNTRDFRSLGALVRRDRSHGKLQAEYEFSPKTSIGGGLTFDSEHFKEPGFRDDREYAMPVNLYYELSPKTDVSAGYRLRQVRQPGFANTRYNEQFFNMGLRGEFTPKTSGSLQLGLADNHASGGQSQSTLGIDGSLTWAATPKIACTVLLSRDFRASNATGESVKTTASSLAARYAISEFWSATGSVRYENTSYFAGRNDDFVTLEMFFNYSPSTLVVVSGGCVLESNRSNAAPAAFDRNVLTFSASLRY
jgi:hypothetical protein